MRQNRHAENDSTPHFDLKTALLTPFHREFAPPHIISSVGTHTAYYIGMKSNTNLEGAKMTKKQCSRISAIMVDYYMGKTGTQTKAQVLTRLSIVVGTHAEAVRVFDKIMR